MAGLGRWRILLPVPFVAVGVVLLWWRGPDWHAVRDAFTAVRWWWVIVAVGLNLISIVVRAIAWNTAIRQAMPAPYPRFRLVFSAFCVGLFGNAVLPGRVGEIARVAVLARRLPRREGTWATLIGSVFAHRVFDLFPTIALVIWVLFTAKLPDWAVTSLEVVLGLGIALFAFALISARGDNTSRIEGLGKVRSLLTQARVGLAVMRRPIPALTAGTFQFSGWACQLLAVFAAMHAFRIYEPLAAAGLVLVLMNVATIFPLWPGNVGLLQAAIAYPLTNYGVDVSHGIAFGIGLQAIEASVGVGIGLIFLAREGLSYATLKQIPSGDEGEVELPPVAGAA